MERVMSPNCMRDQHKKAGRFLISSSTRPLCLNPFPYHVDTHAIIKHKKDAKINYKWIEVYPLFSAIHILDSLSLLQII